MSALRIIHAALTADESLAGIVDDRIYEHVPARARMPYVVLGQVVIRPWDTASDRGRLEDVTVHVWSREASRAHVDQAVARVEHALSFDHLAPFAAQISDGGTSFELVNVVRGEIRTERLPERDLVHATMRFRLTREELT